MARNQINADWPISPLEIEVGDLKRHGHQLHCIQGYKDLSGS